MQDNIVEIRGIGKAIADIQILDNIFLEVKSKECLGIIGENGSGKTTLLRILTGLVSPTSGEVSVFGHNPKTNPEKALFDLRALIGIPAFYSAISAYDNLRLFANNPNGNVNEKIMAALKEVGLQDEKNKKVGVYSRGMLQRLGIAHTLFEDPALYVFDEPTQGVDEVWVNRLIEIIKAKLDKGKTFIITSHNFEFISELCGRVLILDHGKAIYQGKLKEVAEYPYYYILRGGPEEKILKTLESLDYVHKILKTPSAFELTMPKTNSSELIKTLVENGCQIEECAYRQYSTSDLVQHLQTTLKGDLA